MLRKRLVVAKLVGLCLKREGTVLIKACLFAAFPKDDDDEDIKLLSLGD